MDPKYKVEVIWRTTISGASQRANIYRDNNASDPARRPVKDAIKRYMCSKLYPAAAKQQSISEGQLREWIEAFRTEMTRDHAPMLANGTMQYGNAQKFVNLFLKYMWVMGLCPEPPHFPVDSVIQKEIHGFKTLKWTNMGMGQYAEVINAARRVAEGQPLAQ